MDPMDGIGENKMYFSVLFPLPGYPNGTLQKPWSGFAVCVRHDLNIAGQFMGMLTHFDMRAVYAGM